MPYMTTKNTIIPLEALDNSSWKTFLNNQWK